jgi:Uma2 family endonuclease
MSVAEPLIPPPPPPGPEAPPPLENGDHLPRAEFERRYEAMPQLKKAELLKGIVYMPSPVSLGRHGAPHARLVAWLAHYQLATPGVEVADNSTVRLGPEDEPQPDALLMILPECGGQAEVDADGYLEGAPELAAEVASSSVSYDLHVKLDVYREHGVREYVVWRVRDRAIDWLVLRGSRYEPLAAGEDGILRSEVFPGLWLDPQALLTGDGSRLIAVLQQGVTSADHQGFVDRLTAR